MRKHLRGSKDGVQVANSLLAISQAVKNPGAEPKGLTVTQRLNNAIQCVCVLPVLVGKEFEEAPQFLRHTSIALHQGQGGQ